MKKLLPVSAFLLLTLVFSFTSCEKEKTMEELIIGRWAVESFTTVNYIDNVREYATTEYYRPDEFNILLLEDKTGIVFENHNPVIMFTWFLDSSLRTLNLHTEEDQLKWNITVDEDIFGWSFSETKIEDNHTLKIEYVYSAMRVRS